MRNHSWSLTLQIISLATVTLLAGCATQQAVSPSESDSAQSELTGNYARIDQQLSAVDALIELEQIEEAALLLDGLNIDDMNTDQQTRFVRYNANIALINGDGQVALEWLSGEYAYLFDGLPLDDQIKIGLNRALANEYAGKPLAAARERIFLAPLLDDEEAERNQDQIWFNLQLVPVEQIQTLVKLESSPDLNGWLALALIGHTQGDDLYKMLAGIESWQKQYRSHPAAKSLPASLQILKEIANSQPTHVGVLLPLTGPLAKAGSAIRDGIITAWYQAKLRGQEVPELSFFDTSSTDNIVNLYKQAITSGVQTVIGPLAKSRVQQLSMAEELPIPVLALNYADKQVQARENFYQFGLAPEDEAIQIAHNIWQEGVRHVLVLAPNSDWGKRVSDAFISTWQNKGGVIANKSLFNAARPDLYLASIKSALNVNTSETRHTQLQRLIDSPLVFETRRRQDIDAVFMLAFPAQARQLKPILNYQRASDLPIVATSSIYSGVKDKARDKDIEGVRFVETPWRLETNYLKTQVNQAFPQSLANHSSLVALGLDAYKIYNRLPQMAVFQDVRINGSTGTLGMSELGRVQRTLDWAIIDNGIATRVKNTDLASND
ncbi:penicillin-binding protein activator [Reinekea forsetii]|nr:penicillin-binding protein activator [Reinekea forsetii]